MTKFFLVLIILLGLVLRLYKIDSPIADWHSWRQSDTAAVTKTFLVDGFNPFYPKAWDMSTVSEANFPNLERYRFVEFPIYNMATYPLFTILGPDDRYARLVSALFSLASIIFIFLITKKYFGRSTALLASLIFAILPYNVFYSRTTLPEPTFVFFALGMVYFVDQLIDKPAKRLYFIALFFSVVAFLIKPWAIFFVPPLIYKALKKDGFRKEQALFFLLAVTPFILWRLWILQRPESIPANGWLINGDGIRFRPAFWRWIISERLGREILGVTGFFLFLLGLVIKPKANYFMHIWALSLFAYLAVVATGNVRHDYYQVVIVPILTIFLARGFIIMASERSDFIARFWRIPTAGMLLLLCVYFTFMEVRELYKVNNPDIVTAGKFADRTLPKNAVVLAPYNGDTAFLYQIQRPGWPIAPLPIPEMVENYGVNYYVSVNRDNQTNWVLRHFKILEDNSKFVIVDLTKIEKPFDGSDPEPH